MKGRPTRTISTQSKHKSSSSSSSSTTNQTTAAIQFSMTPHETRLINDIVQYKDTSMQSLKHPKVQEIIKTRKGRWVKEEEEYANFLSKEFFMGLADIKEGTTKRSYLSNKLNCTKMRISKKFKGQNNGKEVFTRRTERPDNGEAYSLEEIRMHRQRHVQLEKEFILSTLTTLLKTTGNKSIYPRKTDPPPYQPPPAKPQPIEHKPLPQAPALVIATSQGLGSSISHGFGIRSSPKRRSTSDKPQVTNRNDIQVQDYTFPSNNCMPMANLDTTSQLSKGVGVNQEASLVTATSHNVDALHCLEMMQKNYKYAEEEHNKPVSKLLSSVGYGFPPLNQFAQQFKTIPPVAASRTVSASASDPSSADGSELSFELNNTQALPKYTEVSSYSTSNNGSTVKSESMPDILAGFDQMKKNKTDAPIPEDLNFFAGAGIGESPCITSRSFDELHKFGAGLLGSGDKIHVMPHLDLNHHPGVDNKSQQPANANHGLQHGIPTSVGGFSNVAFSQIPPQHHPNLNAAYYYRPTSTSNSSDLSTSDFD